jgi:hypothetical protein
MGKDQQGFHGRRDFLKTTTLAGMAATLPTASLLGQDVKSVSKTRPIGKKRTLLFLTDSPSSYEKLIESIKAVKEFDFLVSTLQVNYQKLQDLDKSIQEKNADLILMILPRVINNSGNIPAAISDLDVPIIFLPVNLDLIMLEADMVSTFRSRGVTAMLANSESHAIELLKIAATPMVLEGKKAVIYGRPFDSSSIPARNLNADYVYKHTGVQIVYRPIEELKPLLQGVDEARARKEMERWKKEAAQIVEPSDQAILEESRLYVLLRSIVDKENLSAISIDCLSFSFDSKPLLPLPCLSFTRLRDEGIAAPCEADVCASLSSMLLQQISGKPSYFCNVSAVNEEKSTAVLRHCVAPLKLMGPAAPQLSYNLRDYHGLGRGATPEVDFPVGIDVTLGCLGKDLKTIVLWPGRTISRKKDTDRPSFENAPPAYAKMRKYCSNHLEVKVRDIDRFIQSISGCHYVMVAGSYTQQLRDAMLRMGVTIIGPSDSAAPAV